jgi:hypothetical protein
MGAADGGGASASAAVRGFIDCGDCAVDELYSGHSKCEAFSRMPHSGSVDRQGIGGLASAEMKSKPRRPPANRL